MRIVCTEKYKDHNNAVCVGVGDLGYLCRSYVMFEDLHKPIKSNRIKWREYSGTESKTVVTSAGFFTRMRPLEIKVTLYGGHEYLIRLPHEDDYAAVAAELEKYLCATFG